MVDFAEGMLELVQVLHVEQDVASTTQLLLRATADLMAGQDDSMSFVRKASIYELRFLAAAPLMLHRYSTLYCCKGADSAIPGGPDAMLVSLSQPHTTFNVT